MKRNIIKIDSEKCNGCGLCIPNCPEGALQVIDGKARLVSDLFCDGLGACIGHCPQGAMTIEERETEEYDEKKVMKNIVKHGENTIKAHLKHLKDHGETKYYNQAKDFLKEEGIEIKECDPKLPCDCPGTMVRDIKKKPKIDSGIEQESALSQWPIQLKLLPIQAPFFNNSDLLVAADCTAFSHGSFHNKMLNNKSVVIGCPKLDDIAFYEEKLTEIFKKNNIKSITVVVMEVPCCTGMNVAVENALKASGKDIPLEKIIINIDGSIK